MTIKLELLSYFEIVESEIHTDKPTKEVYQSKGVFVKRVQDIPLRGKAVF